MCNARSIVNKLCELHYLMYGSCYDCIFVTESWLTSSLSNGLIDPHNKFTVLRGDRSSGRGGGVCALINKSISVAEVVFADRYSELELIALDVLNVSPVVRFFVLYRPPKYDHNAHHYADLLVDCIANYMHKSGSNVLLGDLNMHNINWSTLCGPNDYIHQLILDFVITHGYMQMVDFPTREANLLDILLTDDDHLVTSVQPSQPLGHSDHCSVVFTLSVAPTGKMATVPICTDPRYLWQNGDYDSMSQYLAAINWNAVICYNPSAESTWKAFIDILWCAINMFVPMYTHTSGGKHKYKNSRSLRKCAARKRILWSKMHRNPLDPKVRSEYRECVHKWRHILQNDQIAREERIIEANSLGAFYRYINQRIFSRPSVSTVIEDGVILTDSLDKANAFSRYFSSVGKADNGFTPRCNDVRFNETLECVTVDEADIMSAIAKLKCSLSAGPDNLPPLLFKRLKCCLSKPLAMIFNQLLSVGHVPYDWLSAIVVPVFKKGVTGKLCNYRPISLTCVPSKILEKIVSQKIYAHLCTNKILHPSQHGFCQRKSTATNLLECFNDWTLTILSKEQRIVVYVDFSKAFDVVSHPKLFARLHSYGIRGTVLSWLQSFLCGRTHRTRIDGVVSDVAQLISGVVQGSGVGPVMFLAYINELIYILEGFDIKVKMFADDVKLYVQIVNYVDMERLQRALSALSEWAEEWQLAVSVDKCCVLNIGIENCPPHLVLDNCVLPVVPHTRDLGVIVSRDLSPATHVAEVISKAHRRAKLILRTFTSRNTKLLVRAFVTYVRPILEYNTVIWSPCTARDIDAIESVQRRFTKRLHGYSHFSYSERLSRLKLQSLEYRRLIADLLWCYKIVFNVVDICMDEFFCFNTCTYTRGHAYKLYKSRPLTSIRKNFFSERVINVWNALPGDAVDFSSLPRFRGSILKIDLCSELKRF